MGSVEEERDEFTVLVTGFAPFKSEYPKNPSWEIASRLPAYLPPPTTTAAGKKSAVSSSSSSAADGQQLLPAVRIVVYPEPIRVSYQVVRDLVPQLWDGHAVKLGGPSSGLDEPSTFTPPRRIDLMLHIGMAGPRLHYAIERIGRRDGYRIADVDGRLPVVDRDNPQWAWYGVPPSLEPHVDLDDVLPRWRANMAAGRPGSGGGMPPDLRISNDAGRYLCDFTFFSSLAHLYRREKEGEKEEKGEAVAAATTAAPAVPDPDSRRRVAFMHVPAAASPERIEAGRTLVIELIRALVASELAGRQEKLQQQGIDVQRDIPEAPEADVATGKWYRD